jgi:trk system potassium uptake protein
VFFRPRASDLRVIGFYLGRVMLALGVIQLVPLTVAGFLREWNAASAFAVGSGLALISGAATARLRTVRRLDWSQGMVIVALAWLLGAALCAVPLYLSGHFRGYLPALFEAMSGLTTSGLSLIEDLDHLAVSMNLWRLIMQFIGGHGIIGVLLVLHSGAAAMRPDVLYVGEAREEHLAPNVVRTARLIYTIAVTYLVLGTAALFVAGLFAGLQPWRALFHAVCLFMGAFDTGGFAANSTSIAYYHSLSIETVLIVLMLAGGLSFGLHYELWRGHRAELRLSTETRTFAITLISLTALVVGSLAAVGTFSTTGALYRTGVFTMISAHTGTGFAVTSGRLFVTDWGFLAPAGLVVAMALGAMAASTAGGIKALRVGIAAKGVAREIVRVVNPRSMLTVSSYHSKGRRVLRDDQVRSALTVLLLYLATYATGAMIGLWYGSEMTEALFEATSAAANVGLSIGIVTPGMPDPLIIAYIALMWMGRLEFLAVFALIGFVLSALRGRV